MGLYSSTTGRIFELEIFVAATAAEAASAAVAAIKVREEKMALVVDEYNSRTVKFNHRTVYSAFFSHMTGKISIDTAEVPSPTPC